MEKVEAVDCFMLCAKNFRYPPSRVPALISQAVFSGSAVALFWHQETSFAFPPRKKLTLSGLDVKKLLSPLLADGFLP